MAMAASWPMSRQLGAIAVRRMSAASANSNPSTSQRPMASRTSTLACWGTLCRRKRGTARKTASPAASAITNAAAISTATARYSIQSLDCSSIRRLSSRLFRRLARQGWCSAVLSPQPLRDQFCQLDGRHRSRAAVPVHGTDLERQATLTEKYAVGFEDADSRIVNVSRLRRDTVQLDHSEHTFLQRLD